MAPRPLALPVVLALAAPVLAGCLSPGATDAALSCAPAEAKDAGEAHSPGNPRVLLKTSKGDVTLELFEEMAPRTVESFLTLAERGFYDGLRFHRVIGPPQHPPDGFLVQTGDPNTRDGEQRTWGRGGPGFTLEDEFHPLLRHASAGVVSMASQGLGSGNALPNSAGSQFFITLAPAPSLDDRSSVFGRVTEGMDVIRAIGEVATDPSGRPRASVFLEGVSVLPPATDPPVRHLASGSVVHDSKTTEPGRPATFVLIARNLGNVRDDLLLTVTPPEGWGCAAESTRVEVASLAGRAVLVTLTPPGSAAAGDYDAKVEISSASDANATWEHALHVRVGDLGARVTEGDHVDVDYVGYLADGRLFDATSAEVGANRSLQKSAYWIRRDDADFKPFNFTVGKGVIDGVNELVAGAKVGEVVAGRIPPEKAARDERSPLSGRTLVFEIEILGPHPS